MADYYDVEEKRDGSYTVTPRDYGDGVKGFFVFLIGCFVLWLILPSSWFKHNEKEDYKQMGKTTNYYWVDNNIKKLYSLYDDTIESSDGTIYRAGVVDIFTSNNDEHKGRLRCKYSQLGKDCYKITGRIIGNVAENNPISSEFRLTVEVDEILVYDSGLIIDPQVDMTFEIPLQTDSKEVLFLLKGSRPYYIADVRFWNRKETSDDQGGASVSAQSAPARSAPAQSTPAQSTPAQSAPARSAPAQSTPAQSTPAQSTPAQSAPAQSAPAQSAPAQSTPAQSTPAQSGPTQQIGYATPEDAVVPAHVVEDTACYDYHYSDSYSLGQVIYFGSYEQDGNTFNGREPIEWTVIGKKNDALLLLSNSCLDCVPYNTSQSNITWEDCSLRSWLNNSFYYDAFDEYERQFILQTDLRNESNPWYGTYGGGSTFDRVFCLSLDEYDTLSFADPYGHPTEYATSRGVEVFNQNYCPWWLRSIGGEPWQAAFVWVDKENGGSLILYGGGTQVDNSGIGVRPAIWYSVAP